MLTRNLTLKHKKLAPQRVGSFWVICRYGQQAYCLALLEKYSQIHNVIYISQLEP